MFCLLVDKDIPVILTEQNKSLAKSAQKRQNLLIQPFFRTFSLSERLSAKPAQLSKDIKS